ncbi:MAG: hypothetical protein SOX24_02165 [Candidatus Enterosoma sp.]|nr:hypothetical protein [Candidatus Enterosoma sp.]
MKRKNRKICARIAVTAAASVSDTVAWFTATREATVTGGTFLAGTNEGDLVVTATGGTGVTTSENKDSNTQTIMVLNDLKLLDASYSGTALTEPTPFWTDVENGEHKYKAVSQEYDTNSNYYYGVSWNLTFSIDVKNSKSNYDIFFNANSSSTTGGDSGVTKTAFRVFRQSGTNESIVWAPLASTEEVNGTAKNLGYVLDADHTAQYTSETASAHGLISKENTSLNTLALDKGTKNNERGDWLAKCVKDDKTNKATATVRVVVWFEGLDANMISDNLNNISSIGTTMKFYARESASY